MTQPNKVNNRPIKVPNCGTVWDLDPTPGSYSHHPDRGVFSVKWHGLSGHLANSYELFEPQTIGLRMAVCTLLTAVLYFVRLVL